MTASYLDTNVLVFAFGDATHPRRLAARRLIEQAADQGPLVTSVLTVDEFLWARSREAGTETAIEDTKALLKAPVLRFLPVDLTHAHLAVDHVKTHRLAPRDAFHLAVAATNHCQRLLSDDPDFDAAAQIERIAP